MAENVVPLRHNRPPLDTNDELEARLPRDYDDRLRRLAELEIGATKIPKAIADEAEAARVTDWLGQQCGNAIADMERAHKAEKAPYLAASRAIDNFFLRRIERFKLALASPRATLAAYHEARAQAQRQAEAERRQRALLAQRRAAAEAHRLAEEAQRAEADKRRAEAARLKAEADAAEERAAEARFQADMPPAPTTIHGNYGAAAFSVERWQYEVEDPTIVPLGFLMIDDDAVRAAIKDGVRAIPGLRIFPVEDFRVRRC